MKCLRLVLFLLHLLSCAVAKLTEFDLQSKSGAFHIQTLNLFNQRLQPKIQNHWQSDWLLRRQRLQLIDKQLRLAKPDIFIVQEALTKIGSPHDSDQGILSAGTLTEYLMQEFKLVTHDDTMEEEYLVTFIDFPFTFEPINENNIWHFKSSFLSPNIIQRKSNKEKLIIFNAQFNPDDAQEDDFFDSLKSYINNTLDSLKICRDRVVIAGSIPIRQHTNKFRQLVDELALKDSSESYCGIASLCYTAVRKNDMYATAYEFIEEYQGDRILVPRSATIYASSLRFATAVPMPQPNRYSLNNLWPSLRFGWGAQVSFIPCR